MKTIILCGGMGTRLHEETEYKPKSMVKIGEWPVLVHIMNIFAKYGHKEFLLCLGYKGNAIRDYFLSMNKHLDDIEFDMKSGDYKVLKRRGRLDYKISFIETGLQSDTAARVLKAAKYIDEDQFFVSYGDDLSDINIDKLLRFHERQKKNHKSLATLTAAHPSSHFGQIWADKREVISKFNEKPKMKDYVNGGFMVFTKRALNHLKRGETLEDGLERLAKKRKLSMYRHEGFWHGMNTMKDVMYLNELWKKGKPWTKAP